MDKQENKQGMAKAFEEKFEQLYTDNLKIVQTHTDNLKIVQTPDIVTVFWTPAIDRIYKSFQEVIVEPEFTREMFIDILLNVGYQGLTSSQVPKNHRLIAVQTLYKKLKK